MCFIEKFCNDNKRTSAGFRWWGAWGPDVVGGPIGGYKMFTQRMIDEVTSISPYH